MCRSYIVQVAYTAVIELIHNTSLVCINTALVSVVCLLKLQQSESAQLLITAAIQFIAAF